MIARKTNDGFQWQMQREVILRFLNATFDNPGLTSAAGANSANLQWSGFRFTIDGYWYSTSILSAAIPSGYNVASGKSRLFAVGMGLSASLMVYPGAQVASTSTAYLGSLDIPASQVVIGLFKIETASNVSWATSANKFTSATVTFYNVQCIPDGVSIGE